MCVLVDGRRLTHTGSTSLFDWTLTLQPPLTVHNLLPVPSDYQAFERGQGGASTGAKQTGTVAAGGVLALHALDVRQEVACKFVPSGYQWVERGPIALSRGYASPTAGVGGPQALPETFPLTSANTRTPLQMHIERELCATQLTAGADAAAADPGAELALGRSLLVRVYVPFWVVNFTEVLITAALTERVNANAQSVAAARRLAYGPGESASGDSSHTGHKAHSIEVSAALKLDTVECSANAGGREPQRPQSHARVLPGSCELLSCGNLDTDAETAREVLLQLRVLGAAWSPELALTGAMDDRGGGGARRESALAKASAALREGRPVLFCAHVPDSGIALDVVAHLQVRPDFTMSISVPLCSSGRALCALHWSRTGSCPLSLLS